MNITTNPVPAGNNNENVKKKALKYAGLALGAAALTATTVYLVKTGKIVDNEISDEDSETLKSLKEKAKEAKIKGYTKMTREELEEALKEK